MPLNMGSETEFGILGGWSLAKAEAIQAQVRKDQPCLPGFREGVYLANGGRAYVDHGSHNEYSTPETQSPKDLVIHELAGRALMAKSAAATGCTLVCSNIDPATGTTWGTHENYFCTNRLPPAVMAQLYTHLVTRIIFTGAGGLDPDRQDLCSMVISPRACRITSSHASQGTTRRTLVFDKPKAEGGYRLHIMCGESLLSHTASYLKYATTALIAYGLDLGLPIGPGGFAGSPIQVLRCINRDISLTNRNALSDGRRMTAIEIQECLLEDVQHHLSDLPPWAAEAVDLWGETLAGLAHGRPSLAGQLDWLLFRRSMLQLAAEFGFDGDGIRRLNQAMQNHRGTQANVAERCRFLDFQRTVQELYIRLHILGAESLFNQFEQTNCLDHRLPEIHDQAIQQAMVKPPPGRAMHRSRLIRRYARSTGLCVSWNKLWNKTRSKVAHISHAEAGPNTMAWYIVPSKTEFHARTMDADLAFRRGDYLLARARLLRMGLDLFGPSVQSVAQTLCLSCARLGRRHEVEKTLIRCEPCFHNQFGLVTCRLFCAANYGLAVPLDVVTPLIEQGDLLLGSEDAEAGHDKDDLFVFYQTKAWALVRGGQLDQAEELLSRLLANKENQSRTRMLTRTRCYMSEIFRRQGKDDLALALLALAEYAQRCEDMRGDLADHTLPLLGKTGNSLASASALAQAERIQRQLANPLGLARVLCIKARRLKTSEDHEEVCGLQKRTDALQSCPVAKRIVTHWDQWLSDIPQNGPDDYWGV